MDVKFINYSKIRRSEINAMLMNYMKESGYSRTTKQLEFEAPLAPLYEERYDASIFRKLLSKGLYHIKLENLLTDCEKQNIPDEQKNDILQKQYNQTTYQVSSKPISQISAVIIKSTLYVILLSESDLIFTCKNGENIQLITKLTAIKQYTLIQTHIIARNDTSLLLIDVRSGEIINEIQQNGKFVVNQDFIITSDLVLEPSFLPPRYQCGIVCGNAVLPTNCQKLEDYFIIYVEDNELVLRSKTQETVRTQFDEHIVDVLYRDPRFFYVVTKTRIMQFTVHTVETLENGSNQSNRMFIVQDWQLPLCIGKIVCWSIFSGWLFINGFVISTISGEIYHEFENVMQCVVTEKNALILQKGKISVVSIDGISDIEIEGMSICAVGEVLIIGDENGCLKLLE